MKDKQTSKPKKPPTGKQRKKIAGTVKSKTPKQLGYVNEHWTTGIQRAKSRLKELDADTIVLAGDEMILAAETTIQKVWLPESAYPKIEVSTGGRKRRSVYGFLNLKTGEEAARPQMNSYHISTKRNSIRFNFWYEG